MSDAPVESIESGSIRLKKLPSRATDYDRAYYEGDYLDPRGDSRTLTFDCPADVFYKLGQPSEIKLVGVRHRGDIINLSPGDSFTLTHTITV